MVTDALLPAELLDAWKTIVKFEVLPALTEFGAIVTGLKLLAAARYVEMNPVAAGIVGHPQEYPWSSARAHLAGEDDQLVKVAPLLAMVGNWSEFLSLSEEEEIVLFRRHERSGRPLGNDAFVDRLEADLARMLRPLKRGPKPRTG